ncbi:MAG: signal peptidase I [Opitutaceae bacterium]|nr:signal peptidase I [Opitutaceae bacterium]
MFGLFASPEKKMRANARNWLEVAERVWHFRRDLIAVPELEQLQARRGELKALVKERAPAEKLQLGIERLEAVLQKNGGAVYPKSALVDNVEFFLVAALVILGIRTYFVQPFKIPTNSMWPTYNGMTSEVFKAPADEPNVAAMAVRTVAFGAWPHRLDAPDDGEVLIPLQGPASRNMVWAAKVPGRTWLVIPAEMREYVLFVGERPVTVKLPWDFDFDWTIYEAFLARGQPFTPVNLAVEVERRRRAGETEQRSLGGRFVECIRTGKRVRKGERVLAFDELTGDQLLVDRASYHFVPPAVGSGFVFRTGNIPDIVRSYGDQYYIKRLVGTPGDRLELRAPGLFRNGAPISGSQAFDGNAGRTKNYLGYEAPPRHRPDGRLKPGEVLAVPENSYFAMGDNSPNSEDSRYWGFVPGADVVGRPVLVYFPFTRHWGPAR